VVTPAALYLWLDGRMEAAILFFCFNALAHLVVENIVKARLIGVHMRLHDLLVFLSILGGLAAFGVMGIIYGPLIVTIFMTLAEFYERHYQRVMARAFARRME
jgi:predicted PurR-regulated permease PerM